jgi:hypothetical protein
MIPAWIFIYLVYGFILSTFARKYKKWLLFFWLPIVFGVVLIAIFRPRKS